MDYLLRDSYYCGVNYGKYDAHRLINCLNIFMDEEIGAPRICIETGGIEALEGLAIARYQMHKQVYFHKRRRILDFHIQQVIKYILKDGVLPSPDNISEYCIWNDYKVFIKGEEKLLHNEHFLAIWQRKKPFKLILELDLGAFNKTSREEIDKIIKKFKKELEEKINEISPDNFILMKHQLHYIKCKKKIIK